MVNKLKQRKREEKRTSVAEKQLQKGDVVAVALSASTFQTAVVFCHHVLLLSILLLLLFPHSILLALTSFFLFKTKPNINGTFLLTFLPY